MTITPIEPGLFIVDDGQRRWTVAVAGPPDARWVAVDGTVAILDVSGDPADPPPGPRRRGAAAAMAAPMPATVIKILVEAGQTVKAGDTLLVLEAMKMELPIRAARDGRVTAIRCSAGDLVQPGVEIVEIE